MVTGDVGGVDDGGRKRGVSEVGVCVDMDLSPWVVCGVPCAVPSTEERDGLEKPKLAYGEKYGEEGVGYSILPREWRELSKTRR